MMRPKAVVSLLFLSVANSLVVVNTWANLSARVKLMNSGDHLDVELGEDILLSKDEQQIVIRGNCHLNISGPGKTLDATKATNSRLFMLNASSTLTLAGSSTQQLIVEAGSTDYDSQSNGADVRLTYGGAVLVVAAKLNAHFVTFQRCSVAKVGGDVNKVGGALSVYCPSEVLDCAAEAVLSYCNFTSNYADGQGGAMQVYGKGARAIIEDSLFFGNAAGVRVDLHKGTHTFAGGFGGAVTAVASAVVNATRCAFKQNRAADGGAFLVASNSELRLAQSSFLGNGNAGSSRGGGNGGALHVMGGYGSRVFIESTLFDGNQDTLGNAIYATRDQVREEFLSHPALTPSSHTLPSHPPLTTLGRRPRRTEGHDTQ
jgi:hypothetical protein